MQQTMKALLICVVLTGIVVALGVGLDRPRADKLVGRFLTEFSKTGGDPMLYIHKYDVGGIHAERLHKMVKRYTHQLGAFESVDEVLEDRQISPVLQEVVFRGKFEKATAVIRVRIRDDGQARGIANFELDVAEDLEAKPTLRSLERGVGLKPFEEFAVGQTAPLYSYLDWDLHNEIDVKTWSERYLHAHLNMGALEATRALAEFDEVAPSVYRRSYEVRYTKGKYVFEVEWYFHDFYWTIGKFKLDIQMND